jgi:hypothetical protein
LRPDSFASFKSSFNKLTFPPASSVA